MKWATLGNIHVDKSALSDTNVGQKSATEKWPFFEIFRTQMLGNTCFLERGFQDANVE